MRVGRHPGQLAAVLLRSAERFRPARGQAASASGTSAAGGLRPRICAFSRSSPRRRAQRPRVQRDGAPSPCSPAPSSSAAHSLASLLRAPRPADSWGRPLVRPCLFLCGPPRLGSSALQLAHRADGKERRGAETSDLPARRATPHSVVVLAPTCRRACPRAAFRGGRQGAEGGRLSWSSGARAPVSHQLHQVGKLDDAAAVEVRRPARIGAPGVHEHDQVGKRDVATAVEVPRAR